MSAMIVLWLGIGGANAETLTCAGATLNLTSCSNNEVNIDCGAQTSCTVAAKLDLTSGSCIVQRVGSCEVTVVASSSSTPAFSVSTASGKTAVLTLREIQPQCGNDPFVFVEPKETAGASTVTLEGLRATTACSKDGPLLATRHTSGKPAIAVTIIATVLTGRHHAGPFPTIKRAMPASPTVMAAVPASESHGGRCCVSTCNRSVICSSSWRSNWR